MRSSHRPWPVLVDRFEKMAMGHVLGGGASSKTGKRLADSPHSSTT
ncbi:hypothetical protein [Haloarcula sebkhae]